MAAPSRPRIPLPPSTKPVAVLDLAGLILKKHTADGAKSALTGQLRADFEAVAPDIAAGLADNAEAKDLEKKLEQIYERRNNHLARVYPLLSRVSKALQGEYGAANLRRMGEHGFTVDDTPRPPKPPQAPKAPKAGTGTGTGG